MRENVGKRIMEIADIHARYLRISATVLGVLVMVAGFINMLTNSEGIFVFLGSVLLGVLIITNGRWLAEVKTIKMYGFGIIVDKLEGTDSDSKPHLSGEMEKYRQLMEQGIITQEEFSAKMRQLKELM